MQHCPARAAQRLAAAVLALCLVLALAVPHAHAAALQETHGIRMLDFSTSQILSIGNQTSGKCSWYALRYARTILDGKVSSGSGMWSNGAVWSAGGYYGYSGSLSECLQKLYTELSAGKPVIVHLKNTAVSGVKRHTNRTSTYEYHLMKQPVEMHFLVDMCLIGLFLDDIQLFLFHILIPSFPSIPAAFAHHPATDGLHFCPGA